MTRGSAAHRLIVGALAAAGFLIGEVSFGAPASAQDSPQQSPWYMPPAWVHPPQTGPKVRKLPGYYGHFYGNQSYGGFGNGCYGTCGRDLPGLVTTGYGVALQRPVIAIFDPRDFQVVPRALDQQVQPQQYQPYQLSQTLPAAPAAAPGAASPGAKPVQPLVVRVDAASKRQPQRQPNVSMQNGVRIIYLSPVAR